MNKEEFAKKWGMQPAKGYGSALFDMSEALLKDLESVIAHPLPETEVTDMREEAEKFWIERFKLGNVAGNQLGVTAMADFAHRMVIQALGRKEEDGNKYKELYEKSFNLAEIRRKQIDKLIIEAGKSPSPDRSAGGILPTDEEIVEMSDAVYSSEDEKMTIVRKSAYEDGLYAMREEIEKRLQSLSTPSAPKKTAEIWTERELSDAMCAAFCQEKNEVKACIEVAKKYASQFKK